MLLALLRLKSGPVRDSWIPSLQGKLFFSLLIDKEENLHIFLVDFQANGSGNTSQWSVAGESQTSAFPGRKDSRDTVQSSF